MIYIFIGENYFRKKLLSTWKASFAEKFSEHNIIHVSNVFSHDLGFFEQNLLSSGFFSEKNLFIIDDFPFGSDDDTNADQKNIVELFLNILPKINPDNIVVFNSEKVDKRSKLYKEIVKNGEIKDFSIADENELFTKINEVYKGKISTKAITKIIELKGNNFSSISGELDKILISKDFVDVGDLAFVSKDIEENIFEIINDLLNEDISKAILKLRELSHSLDNPYLLYNSLASNLRFYFYIFKLKLLGKSNDEIKNILDLGNRAFLVGKNYKIDKNKFLRVYEKIASIDGKMKSGKLIGSENEDMMYEIERSFLVV